MEIKLGNDDNLSVSDDNSIGDTIILGNGDGDAVSANFSNFDIITLGNGALDTVNAFFSQNNAVTLGNGDGDRVSADGSSFDTITLGNGDGDTVGLSGGGNNKITLGNGNDDIVIAPMGRGGCGTICWLRGYSADGIASSGSISCTLAGILPLAASASVLLSPPDFSGTSVPSDAARTHAHPPGLLCRRYCQR
jgi:hypothetical protein